jgi:hypothetical protein
MCSEPRHIEIDTDNSHRAWFCGRCYASGAVEITTVPELCPKCGQILVSTIVESRTPLSHTQLERVFTRPPTREEEAELLESGISPQILQKLFAMLPSPKNPVTITHRDVQNIHNQIDEINLEYRNLTGDKEADDVNGMPSPAATTRESILRPRLNEKGWSIHDWASESNVDFHTADRYLKGKSNPYPLTRKKLAESLGMKAVDLPT